MYICTRGFRRGGLTSVCGFAHARNGRGRRQIEVANAEVLQRGALRNLPMWLGQVGREDKTDPTPCTLHISLSINTSTAHNGAP